jgi:hypothetical protein
MGLVEDIVLAVRLVGVEVLIEDKLPRRCVVPRRGVIRCLTAAVTATVGRITLKGPGLGLDLLRGTGLGLLRGCGVDTEL